MTPMTLRIVATLLTTACFLGSAAAQDAPPAETAPAAAPADAAAPATPPAELPAEPAEPAFSQEQLDQMIAPIALYPDSLLTQLLMASTYPLEIVEAARWREKNTALKGPDLDTALEPEDWDPSVKAMVIFPDIISRMSDNLDWTQDLGDAFLGQQEQVLDTVQALRKQAYDAGNLKTSEQQTVTVEEGAESEVINIAPAAPETVYVPQYNSAAVYGTPPPATPYYPEANTYSGTDMLMTGALAFGAGLLVGNLIWDDDSDCDWDNGYAYRSNNDVDIDIEGDVNIGNRANVGNRPGGRQPWQHNPAHRGGVQYRDTKTRQAYANRPGARPALDRSAAMGYSRDTLGSGGGLGTTASARPGSGGTKLGSGAGSKGPTPKIGGGVPKKATPPKVGGGGPSKAPSKVASAKKAAPIQKRPTNSIGSAGGNRPTAVGGLGGGAATRAASTRGASSRGTSSFGGGGSKLGGGGGGKRR